MKKYLILLLLLLAVKAMPQTGNGQNYIATYSPNEPIRENDWSTLSIGNSQIEIQYMDASGRPEQTLKQQEGPQGEDIVSLVEYDDAGRTSRQWLPIPIQNNRGSFQSANYVKGQSMGFYNDQAFSQEIYEPSTLNRPVEDYGPGAAWKSAGKSVKMAYLTNTADKELAIKKYTIDRGSDILTGGELYPSGSTHVIRTEDEDGKAQYLFKDFEGRTLLTRAVGEEGNHDTYFVYDANGDLRVVLPPMAADLASLNGSSIATIPYAYCYWYDARHQMIQKKLPGCLPIYYVYDVSGREVMSQTGNQRKKDQWSFKKYDFAGRMILSGICTIGWSHEELLARYKDRAVIESYLGSGTQDKYGYSRKFAFSSNEVVYWVNYYDSYDYQTLPFFSNHLLEHTSIPEHSTPESYYCNGLLTGSFIAFLDKPDQGEYSATYYDYKTHLPIQVKAECNGKSYRTSTLYNFERQPTEKIIEYLSYPGIREKYNYTYDQGGRLIDTYHQLDDKAQVLLSHNEYDAVGKLILKSRHNNSDTIQYRYNIRGWLSEIRSNLFSESLIYNETLPPGGEKCYNGNIADICISQNGNNYQQLLHYDALNRLSRSAVCDNMGNRVGKGSYREYLYYDKMGNITQLERLDKNLPYVTLFSQYKGNQLVSVEGDNFESIPQNSRLSYPNEGDGIEEYFYDHNGNLRANLDYGIVAIRNNLLNLPDTIQLKNGNQIVNGYLADGRRYMSTYKTYYTPLAVPLDQITQSKDPSNTVVEEFYNNYRLKDWEISMVLTSEGYITYERLGIASKLQKTYFYYTHDHLGNVRIAQNFEGWIRQQSTDYYATSLHFDHSTSPELQPFKYGGKELIAMHGVDYYDFSARMYSPMLMRFTSIDPLAEKYYSISPYAYCLNNPVKNIDPDGKAVETVWDLYSLATGVKSFVENVRSGNVVGAVVDGVGIVADAVAVAVPGVPGGAGAVIKGVRAVDKVTDAVSKVNAVQKTYQTYTKTNPKTGEVYTGRTSGKNSPEKNVRNRDKNHHKNKEGYGHAILDQTSSNPDAIRGREQQMIDKNGGAKSRGGTSGNTISGVSPENPQKEHYLKESTKQFGMP